MDNYYLSPFLSSTELFVKPADQITALPRIMSVDLFETCFEWLRPLCRLSKECESLLRLLGPGSSRIEIPTHLI